MIYFQNIQLNILSKLLFSDKIENLEDYEPNILYLNNSESVIKTLLEHNINFQKRPDRLEVDLNNIVIDTRVFINEIEFRKWIKRANHKPNWDKNIAILDFNNGGLYFDHKESITKVNTVSTNVFFIENYVWYLKFIEVLKSGVRISNFFDKIKGEAILYSSTKGIMYLQVPNLPIHLDFNKDYSSIFQKLLNRLDDSNFENQFKNRLFELPKIPSESQIDTLVSHLDTIIQETENNVQLILSQFSFDKFKSDLQKEKEKYFTSLRDLLSKIFSQVIGIPISIGASLFSSYKITNKYVIICILLAIGVYVFFAVHNQLLLLKDVKEIEHDFNKDFEKIKVKSGMDVSDLSVEQNKIKRRIQVVKDTIGYFLISLALLSMLLLFFMIGQLENPSLIK